MFEQRKRRPKQHPLTPEELDLLLFKGETTLADRQCNCITCQNAPKIKYKDGKCWIECPPCKVASIKSDKFSEVSENWEVLNHEKIS